jgi:hypothetical protein
MTGLFQRCDPQSAPSSPTWVAAYVLCALVTLPACASLPNDPEARALYVDLRKGVELSNDTGWVADRIQLEANAEGALHSVCQVQAASRGELEAWLNGEIAGRGASAGEVYLRSGHNLAAVSELLSLERTRLLLRYAEQHAAVDCPFWLEPRADFAGVQGDAARFVVLAETRGFGGVVLQGGQAAIGGGGGGRLLLGRGLGPQLMLALGGEVGGTGAFVANDKGAHSLETTFTAAAPVVLRVTRFSRLIDVEMAPVVRLHPDGHALTPGGRAALGVGLAAMRNSAFMPYALISLGYEHHFAGHHLPADDALQIGTRVGVDWDP